jgi:hypothetical protein
MTRTAHTHSLGKLLASALVVVIAAAICAVALVPAGNATAAADLFSDGSARALPVGESTQFALASLAAGQSVTGTALVRNAGSAAGHFSLTLGELAGAAAGELTLTIVNDSDGAAPVTLYQGSLAAFRSADLGLLAPGESVHCSLSLRQGAVAGGALSLSFACSAVTGA